jgi:4-diphosphocytidyl-2-C-methyl-D-erythritol kinase
MVAFPNAKINLGLHILGKRTDGFHDLATVFIPINIHDVIEVVASNNENDSIEYSQTGTEISSDVNDNLCIKAYHLIKQDFPNLSPVKMHLHKKIPMGAGLGGGSADGAFMLNLLNKKFDLGIDKASLAKLSLQLGSDCPFFIYNKPAYATGRGEIISEINLDISHYHILIVNPGIHINTGWAFKSLQLVQNHNDLLEVIQAPIQTWKSNLKNDFEVPIFNEYSEIAQLKQQLYDLGALYAAMSGSGSTIFGIFENKISEEIKFPDTYYVKWV